MMDHETPSPEKKYLARYVANAFGGVRKVIEYRHDQVPLTIDVASCVDRPVAGVTSYSTIGLSDYPNGAADKSPRVEFLGACATSVKDFANILATAAFCVMRSGWECKPGSILAGGVRPYPVSRTMTHLYFTSPFLWDDRFQTLLLKSREIAWLLAVPISDGERDFAEHQGSDALGAQFEEKQIDIFDINRKSVF